jgi:hypothetical protein
VGAPSGLHRHACRCGEYVVEIRGPELAWSLAEVLVKRHAATCARAGEPWIVEALPESADN